MQALVEFDYQAEQPDELSIKKGDIIKNVKQEEDGWMRGKLNGKEGLFPDNFVKIMKETESSSNSVEASDLSEGRTNRQGSDRVKGMGVGFGDIFAGKEIKLKRPTVCNFSKFSVKL